MEDHTDLSGLDQAVFATYRARLAAVDRTDDLIEADLEPPGARRSVPMTDEFRAAMKLIPLDLPGSVQARMRAAMFALAVELAEATEARDSGSQDPKPPA